MRRPAPGPTGQPAGPLPLPRMLPAQHRHPGRVVPRGSSPLTDRPLLPRQALNSLDGQVPLGRALLRPGSASNLRNIAEAVQRYPRITVGSSSSLWQNAVEVPLNGKSPLKWRSPFRGERVTGPSKNSPRQSIGRANRPTKLHSAFVEARRSDTAKGTTKHGSLRGSGNGASGLCGPGTEYRGTEERS